MPVRRGWLTLAWVLIVLADLVLFVGWMGASLDENCGDPGQPKCNEFLRNAWPEVAVIMLVLTVGGAVVIARHWRRA